jgi:hyperosmotically inducible periplasmic protein
MKGNERRRMKRMKTSLAALFAAIVFSVVPMTARAEAPNLSEPNDDQLSNSQLGKEVRHKLRMLPYYGVFDNLAYSINGSTVTLYGQVVRPVTRSDAAHSVSRIKGVTNVVNNIEVLPLSNFDDRVRRDTYRSIARTAGLYRYLQGANPSLHIVVNRGHVTLTGVVSNKGDRTLAYMAASRVFGSFSVTNNLQVEGEGEAR